MLISKDHHKGHLIKHYLKMLSKCNHLVSKNHFINGEVIFSEKGSFTNHFLSNKLNVDLK